MHSIATVAFSYKLAISSQSLLCTINLSKYPLGQHAMNLSLSKFAKLPFLLSTFGYTSQLIPSWWPLILLCILSRHQRTWISCCYLGSGLHTDRSNTIFLGRPSVHLLSTFLCSSPSSWRYLNTQFPTPLPRNHTCYLKYLARYPVQCPWFLRAFLQLFQQYSL